MKEAYAFRFHDGASRETSTNPHLMSKSDSESAVRSVSHFLQLIVSRESRRLDALLGEVSSFMLG